MNADAQMFQFYSRPTFTLKSAVCVEIWGFLD